MFGRCEDGKPYGHYPEESLTLATTTCSRKLGMTYKQIAEMLNCHRVPSRSGKPWSGPVLAKVLRRESKLLQRCE